MATAPYNEWMKQEQKELQQVHAEHLAKLKADEPIRRHYEAVTQKYRKAHLEHLKQYARTATSSRSRL
ncbi:MAG: hypothetical protein ACE5JL_01630 [Dehalococcoidia bacterium]